MDPRGSIRIVWYYNVLSENNEQIYYHHLYCSDNSILYQILRKILMLIWSKLSVMMWYP